MTKKIIILIFILLSFSVSNSQIKNTDEINGLSSSIMECFYSLKNLFLISLTAECQDEIKEKIFIDCEILKKGLYKNKKIVIKKLGLKGFENFEMAIVKFSEASANFEESDKYDSRKKASILIWLELWKYRIEEIFVLLKKT